MPSTSPARIDDDLYASAKEVGGVLSRSASQQVTHWARIGRELEAGPSVSLRSVAEVLAGRASYDGLEAPGQALVRASWAEQMTNRLATLNLIDAFSAESAAYAELDADGNIVVHGPVHNKQSAVNQSAARRTDDEPTRSARPKRTGKTTDSKV